MQETRRMRLQSAIQEELSQFISREVKDPRIPSVTLTELKVTQDGSHCTIFVSILGGPKNDGEMADCLKGLSAASGFMRRHLAKALNVRHVPILLFREDRGFENASRVHSLLFQLEKEEKKEDLEKEDSDSK